MFIYTSSWARFARSANSPMFAYRAQSGAGQLSEELLLPDCVRFSCCSRARLRHPLPLLLALPVCLRLASSCCSPIAPASAAARYPIASASTAAPDCVRLNCCSPDCIRFDCCSPIAYPGPMFSNILHGVRGSVHVNKLKYEGRASL